MDDLPDLPTSATGPDEEGTIMGAYDRVNGRTRYIISDVSQDGAWVSVPLDREVSLEDWR